MSCALGCGDAGRCGRGSPAVDGGGGGACRRDAQPCRPRKDNPGDPSSRGQSGQLRRGRRCAAGAEPRIHLLRRPPRSPQLSPPPALRASVVTLPQWPPGGPRGPPPADPTPRAKPREDLGRGFGCSRLRGGSAAPGGPGGAASGPRDPGGAASGPPDPDHHVRLHRGSSPRSLGLQPGQHHCLFRPCPLALSQPAHRHPSRSRCTDSPAPGGPHLT
ncbi:proline-rich protein HaeIII subfamily 1-like isoform X2 [Canis lupus familiaris]|uniref:proline-rich protein HaeIII subfamily 1-like isoform X2 n=1 Tax=Canis lupus familiaris TaxID=9615 RepID=UPI0018F593C9|nr:proline-rich protein HaeIII subfamily 1-like isoform X2 [Canis lupus familiaris]